MRRLIVLAAAVIYAGVAEANSRLTPDEFIAAMRRVGVVVKFESKCKHRDDPCAGTFKRNREKPVEVSIGLDRTGRVERWVSIDLGKTRVHAVRFLLGYMVATDQPRSEKDALVLRAFNGSKNPACCEIDIDDNGISVMHHVYIKPD